MSRLGTKKGVTDLNSAAGYSRIPGHELRPLYSFPGSRPGPSPDPRPHSKALRAQILCPPFWIPAAAHVYGFRTDHFQGRTARHHYLPQCQVRDPLSSWIQRTGCQIDSRVCQRKPGLAYLVGSGILLSQHMFRPFPKLAQ